MNRAYFGILSCLVPVLIISKDIKSWSDCSKSCGDGVMTRNRSCDIQVLLKERLACNGSDTESVLCNMGDCPPINGSWGYWSDYRECTVSCGGGTQSRRRICDSPSPEYGGRDCAGSAIEYRSCKNDDCPGMDHKGKEFIVGFMSNFPPPQKLIIMITTEYDHVSVGITTPLFDTSYRKIVVVTKNRMEMVSLPTALVGSSKGFERKGIHIVAEKDIIVYAVNKAVFSTDAFLALPVDALGQEYYVVSWDRSSVFMIVGIEDNTNVNVKCGKKCSSVTINDMLLGPGISVNVVLNRFETFSASSSSGDFTGTHILASRPVTVISGSITTEVGSVFGDHLSEQILPVEKWGKSYVTVGMPDCSAPDTYRIVAGYDNTIVNISGSFPVKLEKSGDFYTFNLPDHYAKTITSDKGIALALYANGGCNSNSFGDPTMVILPSVDQFSARYMFSTVVLEGEEFINSVALVIGEAYIEGLRMDDRTLPPSVVWRPVEGRNDIKYTEFRIATGAHFMYHLNPAVTFLVIATGVQLLNSYGYTAGLNFSTQYANRTNKIDKRINETGDDFGLDPCKNAMCLNAGSCAPLGWTSSKCICPFGFGGPICEIDLCKPYPSDIVFVIDTSFSIGSEFIEIQKQNIIYLPQNFTIDEQNIQFAIVSFSSYANIEVDFGVVNNETNLDDMITGLTLKNGSSQTHQGIETAINLLTTRNRQIYYSKARKYIIVISDGLPSSPSHIRSFASDEYTLHIVALGEDVSHYYLEKMAGSMSNVFPPNPQRLWNHMMSELIDPICNTCHASNETDLVIMVDVSRSMGNKDMIEDIPNVTNKILKEMGTNTIDTRLSLVTYDSHVRFVFKHEQYSKDTKFRLQQQISFYRSSNSVSNLTRIFSDVIEHLYDTQSGARHTAKKIVLVISNFQTEIDITSLNEMTELFNSSLEIFTIGMHSDQRAFDNMLRLASSSFHVGSIGEIFADQIDTFISAFVKQLSYVKCSIL